MISICRISIVSILLLLNGPAIADDSIASMGAGGIVLEKTEDIALVSEALFISRGEVRVRFEFRNESATAVKTLVAFALPDVDPEAYHKREDLAAPNGSPENFINFSVKVDGQVVEPMADSRALFQGRDVTEVLQRAGIPALVLHPAFKASTKALAPGLRKDLSAQGLLSEQKEYGEYSPQWTSRVRFYWTQQFPPGEIVTVEHTYKPIVGVDPNFHGEHLAPFAQKRYCIDPPQRRVLQEAWVRSAARTGHGALTAYQVDYMLSTGANWRGGTIDRFRVVVDLENENDILATCFKGLKKVGPTTFTADEQGFSPQQDLYFLFVEAR